MRANMKATTTEATGTLAVDNKRFLQPRKSVIGKLGRPSFQAQRLSDVGVAFGQHITANVGLKLPASQERVVEQTRWLYLRYIFVKLREYKLPLRDLNLTKTSRSKRAAALGVASGSTVVISISEPPSASINCNENSLLLRQQSRSRPAQSVATVDAQDLDLLASRLKSHRRPKLQNTQPNHINNNDIYRASDELNRNSALSNGKDDYDDEIKYLKKKSRLLDLSRMGAINRDVDENDPSGSNAATNGMAPEALKTSSKKSFMDPTMNNQIFTVIYSMIKKAKESRQPEFYGDAIYEVIGIDKFSSLDSLLDVQRTICQEMTRTDISWDIIIALFSLFGAMSLDCVRLGAPENVGPILDGFIGFVERDLAYWISQQGGWEGFLYKYRASYPLTNMHKVSFAILLPFFSLMLLYLAFR